MAIYANKKLAEGPKSIPRLRTIVAPNYRLGVFAFLIPETELEVIFALITSATDKICNKNPFLFNTALKK